MTLFDSSRSSDANAGLLDGRDIWGSHNLLSSGGIETRSLPPPSMPGQRMDFCMVDTEAIAGTTFTVVAATDLFTSAGHTLADGDPVTVSSTGTLPAPLAPVTVYYARDVAGDDFKLASTPGGVAIDITNTGTGVHTVQEVSRVAISAPAGQTLDGTVTTATFLAIGHWLVLSSFAVAPGAVEWRVTAKHAGVTLA
jgi:hypothetical protein